MRCVRGRMYPLPLLEPVSGAAHYSLLENAVGFGLRPSTVGEARTGDGEEAPVKPQAKPTPDYGVSVKREAMFGWWAMRRP